MQWEQLSFLNPDFSSRSQPFDPCSNFERDPFSENFDSALPINRIEPIVKAQQPCARQQVLERILEKISQHDLPSKQCIAHYIRHKYRRNCKANTLRLAATSLMQFLSFFRTSGKMQLEQMSREDLEAFVEDMQDRPLKRSFLVKILTEHPLFHSTQFIHMLKSLLPVLI